MTCEEYLSQFGTLSRRITFHTERLRRLRREADAVSSPWGEHPSSGSREAPYVRLLERIETQEEELAQENELLCRLQEQMEEAIGQLPEEKMRLVLMYRYLEGESYIRIGELLYMDKGTAKRWQTRALERLVLPENPVSVAV